MGRRGATRACQALAANKERSSKPNLSFIRTPLSFTPSIPFLHNDCNDCCVKCSLHTNAPAVCSFFILIKLSTASFNRPCREGGGVRGASSARRWTSNGHAESPEGVCSHILPDSWLHYTCRPCQTGAWGIQERTGQALKSSWDDHYEMETDYKSEESQRRQVVSRCVARRVCLPERGQASYEIMTCVGNMPLTFLPSLCKIMISSPCTVAHCNHMHDIYSDCI